MPVEGVNESAALEIQDGPKKTKISRTRIAVTVILGTLVLGFIILGTVLLTGQPLPRQIGTASAAQQRNIRGLELDEILSGQLQPNGFNGTFISGTEILHRNRYGDITIFNIETRQSDIILPGSHPSLSMSHEYEISSDRKYLLVSHFRQRLFRYSYIGNYDIVDLTTKEWLPLTSADGYRLHLLAKWSPIGNAIVFVTHNTHDIFYKPSVQEAPQRVTTTGVPGVIYNGVADWVNEEEVLSSNQALWFSPDGKRLAFARYNDSLTRIMSVPFYGVPGNLDFQYTRAVNIRYPKPGTPNPTGTVHVVSLEDQTVGQTIEMLPPPQFRGADPIVCRVHWSSQDLLMIIWLNRIQSEGYVMSCSVHEKTCHSILELKEPKGWLHMFPPKSAANGTKFAMILPQIQKSGQQFRQVCVGQKGDNGEYEMKAITLGNTTVLEIHKFDDDAKKIMYSAVEQAHPETVNVYEVSSEADQAVPQCLTCNLRGKLHKKLCQSNEIHYFGSGNYYALNCMGPGVPEITIRNEKHEKVLTWEDNRQIYEDVRTRQLPIVERMSMTVPGGFQAAVALHLPPDIDRSGAVKYPMLVHVYGGPDSAQIESKFLVDWNDYLTVNRSIITAQIDGRGSANKGDDMLFSIYRNLGGPEIEDQISITKKLVSQFPFIDGERTAIWGWSYGGYASAMALIKDTHKVFKCGIAVAPVTDWALYDTIYTERFMGLPNADDNLQGYERAQLNDKVENLRNKELYLIHGTLDDNVHYQQSMLLAKTLEHHDILFRQQSYTDEDHSLNSVRAHLHHSLEKFLDECFQTSQTR